MMELLVTGFEHILNPFSLLIVCAGIFLGIVLGTMPGLNATMGNDLRRKPIADYHHPDFTPVYHPGCHISAALIPEHPQETSISSLLRFFKQVGGLCLSYLFFDDLRL